MPFTIEDLHDALSGELIDAERAFSPHAATPIRAQKSGYIAGLKYALLLVETHIRDVAECEDADYARRRAYDLQAPGKGE